MRFKVFQLPLKYVRGHMFLVIIMVFQSKITVGRFEIRGTIRMTSVAENRSKYKKKSILHFQDDFVNNKLEFCNRMAAHSFSLYA